jgi:mannose/fructose/N-acetylgalactosamine-specific phosphotransferase system component IIC
LLLGDAQEIIVVGAALDDASRGAVEVGGFVDDDRRIAG